MNAVAPVSRDPNDLVSLRPELIATAYAWTGNWDTATDIADEAIARALGRWSRVAALESPGGWLRRVTLNLCIDEHRRLKRSRALEARLTAVPDGLVPPDHLQFWDLVRCLPTRQRQAMTLRYLADLQIDEIARIMRVRPGTVKASLFAARTSLAAELSKGHGDE